MEKEGEQVHPSAATIALIQRPVRTEAALVEGRRCPARRVCETFQMSKALLAAGERWGYPMMLKTKRDAYDGRGSLPIKSKEEAAKGFASLSRSSAAALYAEKWCPFTKELPLSWSRSLEKRR